MRNVVGRKINSLIPQRKLFTKTDANAKPKRTPFLRRIKRKTIFGSLILGSWFFMVDSDLGLYGFNLYNEYYNDYDFKDKTVWIVGGSSGIGEHIAYQLSKKNANKIILSSRRVNELNRVKDKCLEINKDCDVLIKPIDLNDCVNDDDYCEEYISKIYEENLYDNDTETMGDIDILILNAGILSKGFSKDYSVKQINNIINVNGISYIFLTNNMIKCWYKYDKIHPNSKQNKKHQIVVTSSFVGKLGTPLMSIYSMTKFMLHGFYESIRYEESNEYSNIFFNLICIGPVEPSLKTLPEYGSKTMNNDDNDYKEYDRNRYYTKYWQLMKLNRCAQLYCSSILGNFNETWIAVNPYLSYFYAGIYFSFITPFAGNFFVKKYLKDQL